MYVTSAPASVVGARSAERAADLGVEPADRADRAEPRVPARQPRRRDPRRHGLRRHARRLSRRARREERRAAMGRCRSATIRPATRSPPRRSPCDNKVIVGISGGEAGIRGFLDAYDAKTGKQVWRSADRAVSRRAGQRHLAGRQLGARRRRATWLTGSYDPALEAALLGHRQSGPGLERRRAQGRQPLTPARCVAHRRRDRQAAMAFSVHAPRRARLGCEPDSGAGRCGRLAPGARCDRSS